MYKAYFFPQRNKVSGEKRISAMVYKNDGFHDQVCYRTPWDARQALTSRYPGITFETK